MYVFYFEAAINSKLLYMNFFQFCHSFLLRRLIEIDLLVHSRLTLNLPLIFTNVSAFLFACCHPNFHPVSPKSDTRRTLNQLSYFKLYIQVRSLRSTEMPIICVNTAGSNHAPQIKCCMIVNDDCINMHYNRKTIL